MPLVLLRNRRFTSLRKPLYGFTRLLTQCYGHSSHSTHKTKSTIHPIPAFVSPSALSPPILLMIWKLYKYPWKTTMLSPPDILISLSSLPLRVLHSAKSVHMYICNLGILCLKSWYTWARKGPPPHPYHPTLSTTYPNRLRPYCTYAATASDRLG
ncbi:hypothetical protein DM02DRAFT_416880 [Periconia macrospinosa]|uniref:Uncharacterized protein n=1 Tax=Periconia macrospinosa TaxID=97972 RepID=A0A2V1DR44_9PLEO|nr:hypothetical protein DM02DRAFT_416880 [Periconia macrospinosa]